MNAEKLRMIEVLRKDPSISAAGLHENHNFSGNVLAVHYLTARKEALKQYRNGDKECKCPKGYNPEN